MGLVTLPGLEIQYFSFSEEIQTLATKFFSFIFTISPYWLLLIFCFTIAFIAAGVFYRIAKEVRELER